MMKIEQGDRAQNSAREREVQIPVGRVMLRGDLAVPDSAGGIVLFAHGSGSSRRSPRNRYVAQVLQRAGLATLLMDLLTPDEDALDAQTAALRFDIALLARRLIGATLWVVDQLQTARLPIGYFGASTGAAAALVAAAKQPDSVAAVVSRGGRPDLAGEALHQVVAPTLLIVGGRDPLVLEFNRKALGELPGEKKLEIIPGATHLFEEPGALESVAGLAKSWFAVYLSRANQRTRTA
jgi:dienelactone hydrolase